ncbi:MAG: Paraquat-inducible protein [Verrucomicrobiales bacterium]|nr:Paraquat-inducible protein [Verrucomicrobiales bacterium]
MMTSRACLNLALGSLMLSVLLLVIGITAPVITIRGVLMMDGLVEIVAQTMESKLSPAEQAKITPEDHAKKLTQVSTLIGMFLPKDTQKELYVQTRSIVGSVKTLYKNGACFAATLILLFSVCVPVLKSILLYRSILVVDGERRVRTLRLINAIGKWSMADVFVIAIFIAYLAAKASAGSTQAVAFHSEFGSGFYFFACYCVVALLGQQLATAWLGKNEVVAPEARRVWRFISFVTGLGAVLGFFYLRQRFPF